MQFVSNKAKGRISKRVVCVSRGKKCLFFGNFGVLCFLETPVLRFALLPYYKRICCMQYPCRSFLWIQQCG